MSFSELPDFSGDEKGCPMCGAHGHVIKSTYCGAQTRGRFTNIAEAPGCWDTDDMRLFQSEYDHMHRECIGCHCDWVEKTLKDSRQQAP